MKLILLGSELNAANVNRVVKYIGGKVKEQVGSRYIMQM